MATDRLVLLQVPPGTVLVSVTVVPAQKGAVPPAIAAGAGLTVKTAVDKPADPFQDMIQVPTDRPMVAPVVGLTVAMAMLLLLQVPDVETES